MGYSILREINDIKIGIVGLDSSWRSTGSGNKERGKLYIGECQIDNLYNEIKKADLKICLMHHPLDWIADFEMTTIERKLNQFDLVLRGHVHDLDDKQICTQLKKTVYNTSGKLCPITGNYTGYSVININLINGLCTIYTREYYGAPREDFDKGLRINENGKVEYKLNNPDTLKSIEYDLKLSLKVYFKNATEKYAMLRKIDDYSPDRIDDFFVDPIIYEKSEYERKEIDRKRGERPEQIFLEELFKMSDNILIIGKKESGKTTILNKFGAYYSETYNTLIPVYVDMMQLNKGNNRILEACQSFIFRNMSEDVSVSKEQIKDLLLNGKTICIIDNFNISSTDHILWIKDFTSKFSKNRFILASEEKFYQTYELKELPDIGVIYKPFYLDYFGKYQVREMVKKWGKGKSDLNPDQMTNKIVMYCNNIKFAMTPFNIAVLMTIWDIDRNFVPINEGKVMRAYLETVLDKFSMEGLQRSEYDYDIKQHFLGYIAYEMCKKDKYILSIEEFDKIVNVYHEKKGFRKTQSKFDKIFFDKNILCKNGDYVYFSNTSIMEYCLASYALVDPKLYRLMTEKGKRTNFMHELTFYSGIVQDCTDLLDDLSEEITLTIIDNMDDLGVLENLNFKIEFNIDKNEFKDIVMHNRKSIKEIDEIETLPSKNNDINPSEIKRLDNVNEEESFMDLLYIYGNVIKNAETLDKTQKKIHLENYILGMNFLFCLMLKELRVYLTSKTKEELPEEIRKNNNDLTDDEFEKIKENTLELFKFILPLAIQFYIASNVGTPKLELIISDLIECNKKEKFTRFMLSFLLCDIGDGTKINTFIKNYISEETSKDILKLIIAKLGLYYELWYFGEDKNIDNTLLELITDAQIKLSGDRNLELKSNKGIYKKQLKQQYDANRRKTIN